MRTEEEYIALEQEERAITDEYILLMLFVLSGIKGDLEDELRLFYQKYGKDGVVTYGEARKWISMRNHQRRSTALTLSITSLFAMALVDLEAHFRKFLTEVVAKEAEFFDTKVDVEKLLSRKWGADDLYWLQRLEKDVRLWQVYVLNDIKRAIHKGETLDALLGRMDKRFNSINSALKALGLTESTAVGSLSRQDIFKELGVSKYQFYTKEDERRCETCGALHGVVFPISAFEVGVTASPIHPHCRCWEVPILE